MRTQWLIFQRYNGCVFVTELRSPVNHSQSRQPWAVPSTVVSPVNHSQSRQLQAVPSTIGSQPVSPANHSQSKIQWLANKCYSYRKFCVHKCQGTVHVPPHHRLRTLELATGAPTCLHGWFQAPLADITGQLNITMSGWNPYLVRRSARRGAEAVSQPSRCSAS